MPQLGIYHDDAIYLVGAKSLAEGNGYRIDSAPGTPLQTKYPPLWPAMLAAVWKAAPAYPANLPWFAMLAWLCLPFAALLSSRLFRDEGFGEREAAGLGAMVALSPAAVIPATLLLSELPFLALLLAALLLARRDRIALAGLAAGLAFLTRTAALPLIAAVPLWLVLERRWRSGARFAAFMAPAVVGWQLWTRAHTGSPGDAMTLFYTSYLGYWKLDAANGGLAEMVWENTAMLLESLGRLIAYDEEGGFLAITIQRVLAAASIAGIVRLFRQGRFRAYSIFAAIYSVQLLLWNYPPSARFVLPLLPLAVAGAWTEFSRLGRSIADTWRRNRGGDRVAATVLASLLAALAVFAIRVNYQTLFGLLPAAYAEQRDIAAQVRPALDWVRAETSVHTGVLSYSDPLVYLETGRRGYSLRIPPGIQKRAARPEIERYFRDLPGLARRHGLQLVVTAPSDYRLDNQEAAAPVYRQTIERTTDVAFRSPGASVCRFRDAGLGAGLR